MTMHVCLITTVRPFETPIGGGEKFIMQFGTYLVNRNYKVSIIGRKIFGVETRKLITATDINKPKTFPDSPLSLRIPCFIYLLDLLIKSVIFIPKAISINRNCNLSLIYAQDPDFGGLAALITAKLLRIPVVVSSHGVRCWTIEATLNSLYGKLLKSFVYFVNRIVAKRVNLVIAVSEAVQNYFVKIGVNESKVHVIPVGIETVKFRNVETVRQITRNELSLHDDDFVIGFIGRFSAEKNILLLLRAFSDVFKCIPNAKLVLVGAGPMETNLRPYVHKIGMSDNVIFTGVRSDVERLFSVFDVFVLPSYVEGCPTVLLEAMASGKAIIASDIPSIREIVKHNEEAILVNPLDVEALKQAILLLYNNPDLRAKLGRRAKERVKLYDADRVYGRILKVYEELVHCKAK